MLFKTMILGNYSIALVILEPMKQVNSMEAIFGTILSSSWKLTSYSSFWNN